jgi:hypothetical protein
MNDPIIEEEFWRLPPRAGREHLTQGREQMYCLCHPRAVAAARDLKYQSSFEKGIEDTPRFVRRGLFQDQRLQFVGAQAAIVCTPRKQFKFLQFDH